MFTWKGLPWTALALMACIGTTVGWAADQPPTPPKNPTCVAQCAAAQDYCTLQFRVTGGQDLASCATTTVSSGGCEDLLTTAKADCTPSVTNAQMCTQAVEAAAKCLGSCAAEIAKYTCGAAFATCIKGC
jgi:hypothetical protein